MSKLYLEKINKSYRIGETVHAVKGISLSFDECGLVSIIGPSGCGKTTLLNIIGGLDRYDEGNLSVDGNSTKEYSDADWDAYRSSCIGFVFQNYNLIPHLSVLQNVELAMSFSGVGVEEKKRKAEEALRKVGLESMMEKRPNQLSGGQAQRVAIARALVNDPDIILADEPTGALDSGTGLRVMEILKEISKTKLVIMVTHNIDLAKDYSTRMIELLDGEVVADDCLVEDKSTLDKRKSSKKLESKKCFMSPLVAFTLSFQNILMKKSRTFFTALAGGIGIIGVALVLALSGGLSSYMGGMQSDALSGYPITITTELENAPNGTKPDYVRYPDADVLYKDDESEYTTPHTNVLTQEYLDYIADIENVLPGSANAIAYSRGIRLNLINLVPEKRVVDNQFITSNVDKEVGVMGMGSTYMQVMPEHTDFLMAQYDLIGEESRLPSKENEVLLVVDEYNQMDVDFFNKLGISNSINEYKLTDFVGSAIAKVIPNDEFFTEKDGLYPIPDTKDYDRLAESSDGIYLTVVGILRPKANAAGNYFNEGVVCTTALTKWVQSQAETSKVALEQAAVDYDIHTGQPFEDDEARAKQMRRIGVDPMPTSIDIYSVNFNANDMIMLYLDVWNAGKTENEQVVYTNNATTLTSVTGSLISSVYYALIIFACISLAVSGLMIAIITYVSVVERTKEIGILRSIGARKRDITNVFEAEALIIGFIAGAIGIFISAVLIIPINAIILQTAGVANIASLGPVQIILLLLGSMTLTLVAGFIPARLAAKKDPVTALRTLE
ncbi:ABC transporter ATP-binding protein/permease [Anaerosporobacter sp.]|uniref:ABC transporter ATP-binding protein/permease n=1 Tax=Anaerosporobacter sp. TaxID=1872529 RepID=UPI00286F2226|nr:ATP-binding cassette domain-containing protein [Anaerosporobacter sp.]